MEKVKVRDLNVEDIFAVARMLGKVTKGARMQLALVLADKKKGKKPNPTELGMVLFQSLVTDAEEDMKAWLADLAGVESAEFKKMPATALLDVIDQLTSQEGIGDFFVKVSLLANKLTGKG